MATVKITVTQADIDNGVDHSCSRCPVVLALARVFNVRQVDVNVSSRWLVDGVGWGETPDAACDFIRDFDNKRPVKPFEFFVDVAAWEALNELS